MAKSQRPTLEQLEDRCVPATFGVPWPDATHLTLSFVPDETAVPSGSSRLFQTLSGQGEAALWQQEILRAFQTWAANSNVNIGLVPDHGLPLGTGGAIQGDSRFGDVRIAALPLSSDLLATSAPFDWSGTTWSGDILLNSSQKVAPAGQGLYDLYSVILHEAGHVLGLPHNESDPASALYHAYQGARFGLTADDLAQLHALYGPRQADAYEGSKGNDTPATAAAITSEVSSQKSVVDANLTTLQDVDTYSFRTTGKSVGALAVRLRTSGVSLLMPRLTVQDAAGNVVASAAATTPLQKDLTLDLSKIAPGTYVVKVEKATDDVFGIGSYRLEIGDPNAPAARTSAAASPLGKDRFTCAINLQPTVNTDARFAFVTKASLADGRDVDLYRVKSSRDPAVLKATVWTADGAKLTPKLSVYDAKGTPVPVEVIGNESGSFTVQLIKPIANANYYLEVSALRDGTGRSDYTLGVDFLTTAPVVFQSFVSGTLSQGFAQDFRTLTVRESHLYQFVFSATTESGTATAGARMTIFDSAGRIVFTRVAIAGDPASTGVAFLRRGTYVVRFTGGTRSGELLPAMRIDLRGRKIDEHEGIGLIDPTENPMDPGDSGVGGVTGGGGGGATSWDREYDAYYIEFTLLDPYSDPFGTYWGM